MRRAITMIIVIITKMDLIAPVSEYMGSRQGLASFLLT